MPEGGADFPFPQWIVPLMYPAVTEDASFRRDAAALGRFIARVLGAMVKLVNQVQPNGSP